MLVPCKEKRGTDGTGSWVFGGTQREAGLGELGEMAYRGVGLKVLVEVGQQPK